VCTDAAQFACRSALQVGVQLQQTSPRGNCQLALWCHATKADCRPQRQARLGGVCTRSRLSPQWDTLICCTIAQLHDMQKKPGLCVWRAQARQVDSSSSAAALRPLGLKLWTTLHGRTKTAAAKPATQGCQAHMPLSTQQGKGSRQDCPQVCGGMHAGTAAHGQTAYSASHHLQKIPHSICCKLEMTANTHRNTQAIPAGSRRLQLNHIPTRAKQL
jgi:hypothetical protein